MNAIAKWPVVALLLLASYHSIGQNIKITDTVRNDRFPKSDSSFVVVGEVIGKDSGSIKIYTTKNSKITYVPLREGKFFFAGTVDSVEQLNLIIVGDYNQEFLYIEPGEVRVQGTYRQKFTARGTKENDLNNYFSDTLMKDINGRFWDLGNKMEIALKEQNLEDYIKLVDSFETAEQEFFVLVDTAIAHKKFGLYLLACVNFYAVNYGHFAERRRIFDQLPDYLKQSDAGRKALDFLEFTVKKNTANINFPASNFTLRDINKKQVNLSDYNGKVIVLDFWASWCVPCIKALPMLKKIQSNPVSKDVIYLSVSIDKDVKAWETAEKKVKIPWPSLLADEPTIERYKVQAVPNYIVIDKGGKIVSNGTSLANLYTKLKELSN